MDEAGNHRSQQTNTRIGNQTLHVEEGRHHTPGSVRVSGTGGGIALEEIPNVDDGLMGAANHHGTCIPM